MSSDPLTAIDKDTRYRGENKDKNDVGYNIMLSMGYGAIYVYNRGGRCLVWYGFL